MPSTASGFTVASASSQSPPQLNQPSPSASQVPSTELAQSFPTSVTTWPAFGSFVASDTSAVSVALLAGMKARFIDSEFPGST